MRKRLISILLASAMAFSIVLCGCSTPGATQAPIPEGPDYSDSNLKFDFYGYSSYSDGTWSIDNVKYSAGEDFRTLERIQEYADTGMTIFFPQHAALYWGQDWETSETKKALDMAVQAGIQKTIINDSRIQSLSRVNGGIVGEGKQFATTDELDALIAEYMTPYRDHEGFYGLMLGDEPFYQMAEAYGEVYKSVKRVCPECFVQYNLNPITAGTNPEMADLRFPKLNEEEASACETDVDVLVARYRKYLRLFLDSTGANYIQYDQYPLKKVKEIDEYYILGLQVVAELAKEYDIEFYFVSQTYGQTDGIQNPRMLDMQDLYWINNMLVGFGVKTISYFTYWTKSDNNTESFIDGNSFITWYGEKTDIYYWMKQIMEEEQKLAPTILNFDYVSSKIYRNSPTVFDASHTMNTIETPDFTAVKDVVINKEVALVTELYDSEKQNYMYMVQNVIDPDYKGSKAFQTVELTFDSQYQYAVVFVKGERSLVRLNEGKLIIKQKAGDATYVIPY